MTLDDRGRERRIRLAGIMVLAGLLVEVISLLLSHPTAFLLFAGPAALLVAGGIAVFLLSLVS